MQHKNTKRTIRQ